MRDALSTTILAARCTTSLVPNRHARQESAIVKSMNALFSISRKLSILALIVCGIAQFSCPVLWSMPQPATVVAAGHGCHKSHQAPAPDHKKCCIASHSQQADVAVRYIAPKLIDNPENAAADLTATSATTKGPTRLNPYSVLRYPVSVLRI